jgi:Kef-type K+ transport system membrane component KefB
MGVAVAAALLLRRLTVPPVVGFIRAGVAIGPAGFGLVSDREHIELVAEIDSWLEALENEPAPSHAGGPR